MKVSLNIIKQYTAVDITTEDLVSRINQQLGKVEEIVDLGVRYNGAVIAKIVSCEDHPDADRLHVCKIDDGGATPDVERDSDGLVQVVCGAPNARAGIMVVWLPPGATVPASYTDTEPFVLGSRPLRGVISHGMLASPRELGIGDSHEGILEIDPSETPASPHADIKPGALFAEVFGLNDTIIDIENKMFTHRPDCFGQLGVAREIAGIQHQAFTSPTWYATPPQFEAAEGLALEVRNEIADVVPRFIAVAVKDIVVKPSPLWLQIELVRLGSRPINNIVDVTNYVMLLTGQPLHAYDYDKVAHDGAAVLGVRRANEGEQAGLLSGKTVQLDPGDIIITDGTNPIGIGGVMGGADTEVSNETKNIILECATFDMYTIRKTSMRHGLFTDAVTRFNKGQSPLQNPYVVNLAMAAIKDVAGGVQASDVIDTNPGIEASKSVVLTPRFINERLGLKLASEDMAKLLTSTEFAVKIERENLEITPPFWRTDIELPEDVVEEVGRLYGFDKLPRQLPSRSIKPAVKNATFELKRRLRGQLAALGANEVLTYSFVHENVLKRAGQDAAKAFKLSNALSPDLQYYRLSLTPSLLDKVHGNIKAGYDAFALFEIGKVHATTEVDDDGLPKEFDHLALVFTSEDKNSRQASQGAAYYRAKTYLDLVLTGVEGVALVPLDEVAFDGHELAEQMVQPYEPGRAAMIKSNDAIIGIIGEFRVSTAKSFKLPASTAGFEIFLSALTRSNTDNYVPLPRFPKVWQDISLKVPSDVPYQSVFSSVQQSLLQAESGNMLSTLEPTAIYQSPEDAAHKTITLRYTVASYDKTLTDTEVAGMLDVAASAAGEVVKAERI